MKSFIEGTPPNYLFLSAMALSIECFVPIAVSFCNLLEVNNGKRCKLRLTLNQAMKSKYRLFTLKDINMAS